VKEAARKKGSSHCYYLVKAILAEWNVNSTLENVMNDHIPSLSPKLGWSGGC
jgi:hypothetical protein